MGYGNYSFGVAKLIDVVWDVTVGRGGQVLLAAFTYKAFTKSLTRNMESSLVSVETFKAMTLQNDTFYGVLKMMRYFQQNGGKRAKVAMFWTILSALFVLLMPTWLSAMTGYVAAIEGFVQDSSDNLVPFEEFRPVIYTIHDGDRLGEGYTKDYRVAIPWVNYEDNYYVLSDYYGCWSALSRTYNDSAEPVKWKDDADASCTLLWRLSEYTSQYGFLGLNNTETDFTFPNMTNVTIPEPSLNISANFALYGGNPSYYDTFEWWYLPYGVNWRRNDTNEMPFATSDPFFYHQSSGTGYNLTELNQNGSCQQLDNVRYKWGFSFILLYAFIATWLIWNIVVFGIYLDSYLHSRLDVAKRSIGLERAVFDLSLAMQKRTDAESVVMTGNDRLQHLIRGGHMTYKDLPLNSLPPTRWNQIRKWWEGFRFWPWAKAEKWWLAAMLIFDLFFILSVTTGRFKRGWCPYFSALPGFGVFLVLLVGRNAQGRWLIFVFWFLLFWIGNIWWILWGHNY
ncbi:hypothetical protein PMZ80_010247 [Knufia obscura]|uniref:Uncharacterized protein n=1 Tax=Knufia obscura TaxID=1635080 RepID=A0ABR0RBJ8_9EURO|nr:hypothetical protein PMZ80_010247 [Knufia obscura]